MGIRGAASRVFCQIKSSWLFHVLHKTTQITKIHSLPITAFSSFLLFHHHPFLPTQLKYFHIIHKPIKRLSLTVCDSLHPLDLFLTIYFFGETAQTFWLFEVYTNPVVSILNLSPTRKPPLSSPFGINISAF